MTESNRFNLSQSESLQDILDTFFETSAPNQSQIVSNVPPRCSFAETHNPPNENCDGSHFASNLQAVFQGLEFLNSIASSDPEVNSKADSMIDVSYCIGKKLTGTEAAKFLKNFRRPTPDFKFPFREHPRRQRAQHKWLVFISHIFLYIRLHVLGLLNIPSLVTASFRMGFTVSPVL